MNPAYSGGVTSAADLALALTERGARVTHLERSRTEDGPAIDVFTPFANPGAQTRRYEGEMLPFYYGLSFSSATLHFYVVLYASVFLVFPGLGVRRRLLYLVIGMAALFAFQVIALLVNVEYVYAKVIEEFGLAHYTPAELGFYEWLQDTAIDFAVQMIPAIPLALLFVGSGGFGRPLLALPLSVDAAPSRRLSPRAKGIALGASGLLLAAVLAAPFTWKVPVRQAEKLAMEGEVLLGEYLGQMDRLDVAKLSRERFEAALSKDARSSRARLGLGLYHYRHDRDFPRAVAEFRKALESDPRSVDGRRHLANVLLEMGKIEEAVRTYLELMSDPTSQPDTWVCRPVQLAFLHHALEAGSSFAVTAELAARFAQIEPRCRATAEVRPHGR